MICQARHLWYWMCWHAFAPPSNWGNGTLFYHWQFYDLDPTCSWVDHNQTLNVNFCLILSLESVQLNGVHHNASQGFCITSFVGNLPYLCLLRLFTWHEWWQFLTYFQMVFCIPYHYIVACSVSRDELFRSVGGSNGTNLLLYADGQQENHDCTCAQYLCVFHQLSGVLGTTGQFVDFGVSFPSLCNFLDCEGINDVLFTAIGKHQVHGGFVYCGLLCHSVRCIRSTNTGWRSSRFPCYFVQGSSPNKRKHQRLCCG